MAHTTPQELSTNLSYNAEKSNLNGAILEVISDEQWRWAQKITSQVNSSTIRVIPIHGDDSRDKDLPTNQKSSRSNIQNMSYHQKDLEENATRSNNNNSNIHPISDIQGVNSMDREESGAQSTSNDKKLE